ncbi:MAG: polymerase [Bacteroidota bacterium]|jgi:DNA polymerase-1
MNEKKLYLLDAFALIFRAYHALSKNPRMTSTGINTNAQFGFTNTLLEIIKKEKPTHLAVCFDTAAKTERHETFAEYKANRQETPEDILAAVPHIMQILKAMRIPILKVDGYEADDVIGHVAKDAEKHGFQVYMVTPDKDYGQLVSENIFIWKPPAFGNERQILGVKEICEKWQIQNVNQVIDILGLMGDAVDNIPGVPGVGEKTASKLIAEYHTIEGVLQAAKEKKIAGKICDKINDNADKALMSKNLATIITDVPFTYNLEEAIIEEPNKEELAEIFSMLEFKTLGKRLLGNSFMSSEEIKPQDAGTDLFGKSVDSNQSSVSRKKSANETGAAPLSFGEGLGVRSDEDDAENFMAASKNISNTAHQYFLIDTKEKRAELIQQLLQQSEFCFDTETTGTDANNVEIVGMSFSWKAGEGYYIPFGVDWEESATILHEFKIVFDDETKTIIGQNVKYDMLVLKWYGLELKGKIFDTMLAHYVIEPEGKRSMDMLSAQYLDYMPVSITELIGKKGKNQGSMRDVEIEKIKEYAAEDADITFQLKHIFAPLVIEKNVEKVLEEIENPLVKVLGNMEFEGIRIDENFLHDYAKELEREAKLAEEKVFAAAGVRFNLSSPKQLGEVLFDRMKLDEKAKKTKSGQYATGEDVLLKLAKKHQIVDDILAYREFTKLNNTYVEKLPLMKNPRTGRVHTSYAQAVAVTGRLSSNDPNLQNIPIRTARGREIRKAFIPRDENFVLLSADYSQIELRIVAAISGDENMCAAFKNGMDIHTATAAKVFGVAESEVTKEMRYKAKSVNFGIIYGQGAFGLAENLAISRTEAKEIIDNYKKQFSGIQKYMDDTVNFAREHGYVQTLMGRKRWLRDINSGNFTIRAFAERNAINSPIQGTAADMIKLAMIALNSKLQNSKLQSKMLLQVHDELVFDVHKDEIEIIKPIIKRCMQNALPLPNGVPADCEMGTGTNWLEAH